jgi:hypothetical protein
VTVVIPWSSSNCKQENVFIDYLFDPMRLKRLSVNVPNYATDKAGQGQIIVGN